MLASPSPRHCGRRDRALGLSQTEPDRSIAPLRGGVANIAHQGGAMLAPGNTLVAYEQALEVGADVIEIDLKRSRDGVLVAIHDATSMD
ncbi:MAG: glycerophosphodiester phosphodiesterase family protein [Natrialbaceae archaeon]|nr:glycerophosphodiester phosphodiesterase family protein [Natrialbaceae archaeon]